MKNILTTIFIFISIITIEAQQNTPFFRIPRIKTFEAGYKYLPENSFSKTTVHGETFWFDYAWQLRGFDSTKNAVYISIPLGLTLLQGNDIDADIHILEYGWTIRHNILRNRKWIPWIGYALLLNNVQIYDRSGSLFGHQTRLEIGITHNKPKKHLNPLFKIEYGYARFPQFNETKSNVIQHITIKVGFRF